GGVAAVSGCGEPGAGPGRLCLRGELGPGSGRPMVAGLWPGLAVARRISSPSRPKQSRANPVRCCEHVSVRAPTAGATEMNKIDQPGRAQTGAELLVRCLEVQGVPFIFGIPGGAISPILEALADGGPRFIPVRHETAGAFMAQAYGRCTGRPG